MKTALITTTINVPRVLELYRRYGPDVEVFVAGDKKTPPWSELAEVLLPHDRLHYADVEWQIGLNYKCSELIGWNCIQRRNIALLEAIKWGAELIVSVDDDNICLDENYFDDFERRFARTLMTVRTRDWIYQVGEPVGFNGLKASSPTGWFDVGQLLQPVSPHRGFPHTKTAQPYFEYVTDAKIGVAAGICMGDPDISAVTRIARGPIVHGVSEILRSGVVTDPKQTWTVFNTQNTAFIRELAPAMFCPPGIGRYDDIVASLVTQRVMRERNLHVHFGKPFVWQQRNTHNLVKDLEAELWGMLNIKNIAQRLDETPLRNERSVVDMVRLCYLTQLDKPFFPQKSAAAALAFCDDVEKVL